MKIAILIPAYNESKTIGPLVKTLRAKGLDVIVIDDGSKDNCGEVAQKKGAVVMRNEPNQGKGYSLQKGFDYILKHGYDGVIAMDGDGQHDTGDIDKFIELAQREKACIINGNRMQNHQGMPWVRFCTNRLMSWLVSWACGQSIADTQCGYRYISSEILRAITLTSGDFEIESEILIKSSKKGFKVYSVPIKTIYRDEVSQIHPLKDTLRFIRYFVKEIFNL